MSAYAGPSRRALVKGAVWAVPVVALASAAPAMAASVCGSGCPSMGFGGALNANGWTLTTTGTFAQGANQRLGYYASYAPWPGTDTCTGVTGGSAAGTLTNVIVGEADPTSSGSSLIYAVQLCLVAGVTYSFSYAWNSYNINSRTAYEQASIGLTATGAALANIGGLVTATAKTANQRGTVTGSYTPTSTGTYVFRYTWTFNAAPTSYSNSCSSGTNGSFANDIAVQAPTITCTPTP